MGSVGDRIGRLQDRGEKLFSPDTWLRRHAEAGGGDLRKTFIRRGVGLAALSGGGFAAMISSANFSSANTQLSAVAIGALSALFGAGFSQRNFLAAGIVKRRDERKRLNPESA